MCQRHSPQCGSRGVEEGAFVEAQLRAIRLGENNCFFAGSHATAERAAAIPTVLATSRAYGANPFNYLEALFTRLARPISVPELAEWTPGRWLARESAE